MDTAVLPTDWLGFPCAFPQPASTTGLGRTPAPLGALLSSEGDAAARDATEAVVWYDDRALHLRARCVTAAMERIRALAAANTPWGRDTWGDDALEVQIDPGATRQTYLHVIISPSGEVVTLRGFNNRHEQGWHPAVEATVTLEDDAWTVALAVPFAALDAAPAPGEAWGFNLLRVNRDEARGYVQWAPTFGDALRPELFGTLVFDGPAGDRPAEVAAYVRRAEDRTAFFLRAINTLTPDDALVALGMPDWAAWDAHLAARAIRPVRWEGYLPGAEGIPAVDRPGALADADALCAAVAAWSLDPPAPESLNLERLDALGDAYLLTGARKYADAFERAVAVHARLMDGMLAGVESPYHHTGVRSPYHDYQIIRAYLMAYSYLVLREAGLAAETHATLMRTMLRACRFADFEIRTAYNYGNHQVYESAGLAMTTALFPEFPESDVWARTAADAIQYHFARELYPDGGYRERCSYHAVAMAFTMQAVAVIRANGAEARFPALMCAETQGWLEQMHEWILRLLAPDGTMPAFGDFSTHSALRFLDRASLFYHRADFAWPVGLHAPALLPAGVTSREPAERSVSLPSGFTVLRSGWQPADFYLAVDHGPLGGQHSHVDTMSFVAYAHGRPVALDTGIGITYDDPRYADWYRDIRAHNVVAVDDREPEKVAERLASVLDGPRQSVAMRSRAYQHACGIVHEREIVFLAGIGWIIHDRLTAEDSLDGRQLAWRLHTPCPLETQGPGTLHTPAGDGGLLVLAGRPETLEAPRLARTTASVPLRQVVDLRISDAVRRFASSLLADVTELVWRHRPETGRTAEFVIALLPYRGPRPAARLVETAAGWTVEMSPHSSEG